SGSYHDFSLLIYLFVGKISSDSHSIRLLLYSRGIFYDILIIYSVRCHHYIFLLSLYRVYISTILKIKRILPSTVSLYISLLIYRSVTLRNNFSSLHCQFTTYMSIFTDYILSIESYPVNYEFFGNSNVFTE